MRCCRWEAESAPPPLALRSHEREGTWRGLLPLAAAELLRWHDRSVRSWSMA